VTMQLGAPQEGLTFTHSYSINMSSVATITNLKVFLQIHLNRDEDCRPLGHYAVSSF
jgi:hypothetical protein